MKEKYDIDAKNIDAKINNGLEKSEILYKNINEKFKLLEFNIIKFDIERMINGLKDHATMHDNKGNQVIDLETMKIAVNLDIRDFLTKIKDTGYLQKIIDNPALIHRYMFYTIDYAFTKNYIDNLDFNVDNNPIFKEILKTIEEDLDPNSYKQLIGNLEKKWKTLSKMKNVKTK